MTTIAPVTSPTPPTCDRLAEVAPRVGGPPLLPSLFHLDSSQLVSVDDGVDPTRLLPSSVTGR